MKQEYINENKEVFKAFLDITFFKNWRESSRQEKREDEFKLLNYGQLELNIGYSCDLKCQYCYYSKYGKQLYQEKPVKVKEVLKNTDKIMNFLYVNKMYTGLELFAGEPFVLPYVWDWLDIVYDYLKKMDISKRSRELVIPTNMSFLKNQNSKVLDKIYEYREKFSNIDVFFAMSASFDGPFMDNFNRPHANQNIKYDASFYQRFSELGQELKAGAHPMIYSNNIEYWIDNFIWFAQNTDNLYLLDVRNWEWTAEQDKDLFYFLRFLVNFIWKYTQDNGIDFEEYLSNVSWFNILLSPFTTIGRGLGCSLQSTLDLQLHDMEIIPCHRLGYKSLSTGKLIIEEDGSWDIEPENVEMYIAEQLTDSTSISPCSGCPINQICGGTCLGANYESTGDPFTVPPTFCRQSMAKIAGIAKGFQDIGMIGELTSRMDQLRTSQIYYILENFKEI